MSLKVKFVISYVVLYLIMLLIILSGEADSETGFKADLIEYLTAYKSKLLNEWVEIIKQHDMSKCK